MTARSNGLLLAAIAVSVGAHLLLLLLVPWKPMQPRTATREIVPVRLVHAPPPVRQPLPRLRKPVQVPQPEQVVMAPEPVLEPAPHEVPSEPQSAAEPVNVSAETVPTASPAELTSPTASVADAQQPVLAVTPQPSAEIAAYQAILSTLRERALKEIRYPPIARANGWKGTVIVALLLDGAGKLQQAIVHQSSGYEILDRAALGLAKKITPVPNPLGLPLTIEVPITYELK